jgi:hypothetical protein
MISTAIFFVSLLSASFAQHVPALHPHITPELRAMTQHAADSIIAEAYWVGHLAAEETKNLLENVDRDHKLQEVSGALQRSSEIMMEKIRNVDAKLLSVIADMGNAAATDTRHAAEDEQAKYLKGVLKSMASKFSEVAQHIVEVEQKVVGAVKDFSTTEAHSINDSVHNVLKGIQLNADELAKKGAELKRYQLRLTHPVEEYELKEAIHSEL